MTTDEAIREIGIELQRLASLKGEKARAWKAHEEAKKGIETWRKDAKKLLEAVSEELEVNLRNVETWSEENQLRQLATVLKARGFDEAVAGAKRAVGAAFAEVEKRGEPQPCKSDAAMAIEEEGEDPDYDVKEEEAEEFPGLFEILRREGEKEEARLRAIEKRLDALEKRQETREDQIERGFAHHRERLDALDSRLGKYNHRLQQAEAKIEELDSKDADRVLTQKQINGLREQIGRLEEMKEKFKAVCGKLADATEDAIKQIHDRRGE